MRVHFFLPTFLLSLAFSVTAIYAQEVKINGKVISEDDKQPVAYANIGIPKKGVGTASNAAGEFVFILPANTASDSIQVSCIGFNTKTIAISTLAIRGLSVTITLAKSNTRLKEVNIQYRDPIKIIRKAIDRIPENYISHPHVTSGFYRNYIVKGKQPLQLSEAVFDIYNYGYGNKTTALFKLTKARDEINQRDFGSLEFGLNVGTIIGDDIVKHINDNEIFGKQGIKRHDFEVRGIVDFKGSPAYEIDFTEKPGVKETTYRGKVFIDTKSYAFLYFDYSLSPAGVNYVQVGNFAERMLMKLLNVNISAKNDHMQVSYQKVADKWVFSGATGNSAFYIKSKMLKYDFVADIKFNYLITKVDTTQVAPFDIKLPNNKNINDYDSNDGDEFWRDYNILLPDFKTEDIFKQLQAVNNALQLKDKFERKEKMLPKDPGLRIDSMLTYYHANGQFNGTALIKSKGKVILSKSYGYADKDKKLTGNPQTTYRIGSTAKTFTSLIINQLISEGKLDLHVPVKTYIPYYVNGDVTIEQLLTHQSGIPEYFNRDDYKLELVTKSFTLKEVVLKFCSDSLEFKSGTGFEYSNSNFTVLALIAQEVTGKPFETLLRERIFTPLQMTDTYFGRYEGNDSHQAIGYSQGVIELKYDAANTAGAGGIFSSAEDLLKYHDGLLANTLLPMAQKEEMLRARVEFKDYNAMYDYGWMTDKGAFKASKKHIITYHPGTDLGFFTMFVRQEDNDSCIILLNNTGEFPRYDMSELILNIMN